MKITILCSSAEHPINSYLQDWLERNSALHQVELVRQKNQAQGGDLLFLISCSEIVDQQDRSAYVKTLVIHASALPLGRGWSPHIWQILEGKKDIPVTLLEAVDQVDSGAIWHQIYCSIPSHALWDEINHAIFTAELLLMDYAVQNFYQARPQAQSIVIQPTHYSKRSPSDSELDPELNIAQQFNKLRICDPNRFPAFFKLHGKTYKLTVEKIENE